MQPLMFGNGLVISTQHFVMDAIACMLGLTLIHISIGPLVSLTTQKYTDILDKWTMTFWIWRSHPLMYHRVSRCHAVSWCFCNVCCQVSSDYTLMLCLQSLRFFVNNISDTMLTLVFQNFGRQWKVNFAKMICFICRMYYESNMLIF